MNLRTAPRPQAKFGWSNIFSTIGGLAGALDGNIDNWLNVGNAANSVANAANGVSALNNVAPAINVSQLPQMGASLARCGGRFGKRPKAFWGAAIGALASLVGQGLAASEQASEEAKLRRQANARAQAQSDANQASAINSVLAGNRTLSDQDWTAYNNALSYRAGGKPKKKTKFKTIEAENGEVIKTNKPFKVTDGGVAQPLGHNTFLLRGGTHEDINPSGNTGIGLKVKDAEILSNKLDIGGATPAEAYLNGESFDDMFYMQEATKQASGINDDGTKKKYDPKYDDGVWLFDEDTPLRFGGKRVAPPVRRVGDVRPKAEDGADLYKTHYISDMIKPKPFLPTTIIRDANKTYTIDSNGQYHAYSNNSNSAKTYIPLSTNKWGMDLTPANYIDAGLQAAGSLANYFINKSNYNNIDYTKGLRQIDYTPVVATPLETRYRIGAQLANLDRTRNFNNRAIANNSSNSLLAREAIQRNNNDITMEENKLLDTKANKEVELGNANLKNIQEVALKNAEQQNAVNQANAAAYNTALEKTYEAKQAARNNMNVNLQGLFNVGANLVRTGINNYNANNEILNNLANGNDAAIYRYFANGLGNRRMRNAYKDYLDRLIGNMDSTTERYNTLSNQRKSLFGV